MSQIALPLACQRWRNRRTSFRPVGELVDTSDLGVELIDSDKVARSFVQQHHYSGSYPAARCRVGLYQTRSRFEGPALVGVAVFSVPMSNAALEKHCGTRSAVELGRFVLLDEIGANAETWFLSRAFSALREAKPDVDAVLSYSDPMQRRAVDGSIVLPGHVGTIYQAHNARHVGRSKACSHWIDQSGRIVSPRALSKLRNDTKGAGYAYDQLIAAGAPKRNPLEASREYVARALEAGPFRRFRHPGNLAYTWALGSKSQRRSVSRGFPEALPYPKAHHALRAAA